MKTKILFYESSEKSSVEREEQREERKRKCAEQRRGAKAQRPKPAGTLTARAPIGSARACGDRSHAHTKRDAHLESLTPFVGAAHACGCI